MSIQENSIDFYKSWLNKRALELGLDQQVVVLDPGHIGPVSWGYQADSGEPVVLGWSVEEAEAGLVRMAGEHA